MQTAHDHKNIWLLKPTGLNRGRGIHIFTTIEELRTILIDNYDINWMNTNAVAVTNVPSKTKTTDVSVIQPVNILSSEDQSQSLNVTTISNNQE
jgi:hypothetical protein